MEIWESSIEMIIEIEIVAKDKLARGEKREEGQDLSVGENTRTHSGVREGEAAGA